MIRIPLPEKDAAILLVPRWGELGAPAQIVLLSILLLAPIILLVWLYRNELRLVPTRTAMFLLSLRLILVLLLTLVVGFQPVAARFSKSEDKSMVLVAVDRSASMDVADPQPKNKATVMSRTEAARKILADDGLNLLGTLAKNHEVHLVGFHQDIWDARNLADLFQPATPALSSAGTNLDLPLARALEAPGRLKGVIVLTDGQHNVGPSHLTKAKELARAHVPVYPVALGSLSPPPDIALFEVRAPANLFQEADAVIEARFKVRALPAQEIHVELWNKKTMRIEEKKTIWHDGLDRLHHVRFEVFLKEPGLHSYEVKVRPGNPKTREITEVNNSMPAVIRVSRDKVKVLIIDGEARWETHYLASALARDRSTALDRVLFDQPRLGRISEAELEKAGNPKLKLPALDKDGDPLLNYDCIFLGDASPAQLPVKDRQRLAQYVSERGGTLVIQAGKRFMPMDYYAKTQTEADPLIKLLPIQSPGIIKPASGFSLALTPEG
ncbi:MAG TPA: vWA domain-containing protein, partial [Gemmataceae bacterium]|nr:vWA domain-containing protein [Gemmataceae bacterium]